MTDPRASSRSSAGSALPADRRAPARLRRAARPRPRGPRARAGAALHGLRRAVLPPGLPAREPDPRVERPRAPRRLADAQRAPARDEQLPRVHGQALPRPLRGGVRPHDQRRRRHDQGDRARDRRARDRGGLGRPAAAEPSTGRSIGVVGSGPAGLACAQQLAAPATRSPCTSATTARRPAALWDPRLQARQAIGRPANRAARGRGRHVRVRGRVRRRPRPRRAARPARRGRARNRRAAPARPEPARTRARRHPSRDAVPHRAEPAGRRPGGRSDRAHGRGQAGRDPRRRRHLRGLPRERPARGCHLRDRDRPRPHAAARANAAADVARVAGAAALLPGARRGRRAPVGDRDGGVRRTGRTDRVVAARAASSTRSTPRRARGGAFPSRTSHSTSTSSSSPSASSASSRRTDSPKGSASASRRAARSRPTAVSRPVSMACSRVATACAAQT